jgi:Mg/Co/Ni transporter MgtE
MEDEAAPWRELKRLLEQGDSTGLTAFLGTLAPLDVALSVSRLDDGERGRLLSAIAPRAAASVIDRSTPTAVFSGSCAGARSTKRWPPAAKTPF